MNSSRGSATSSASEKDSIRNYVTCSRCLLIMIKQTKQPCNSLLKTQNKLIYGVTGQTAADLIIARADSHKPNMALTSWSGKYCPKEKILLLPKNYLTSDEIDSLNRLVTIFLESAELRVKLRKDLTLNYWRNTVDKLLIDHGIPLLPHRGHHSHDEMKNFVNNVYEEFDEIRKHQEAQQA